MWTTLERRRVLIFLGFAFGIAWAFGLAVYLTGGLQGGGAEITPGLPWAVPLVAIGYMGAPALANLLTRLITREGWRGAQLKLNLVHGWPWWLAAWFLPGLLTVAGIAVFCVLFPSYYDPQLGVVQQLLTQAGQAGSVNPWLVVVSQTLTAIVIAPVVNSLFTFGEEFGWRAYLQPKLLLALGPRRAMLLMGVIWGVWHWPVIAMGHNYGLAYPGAPWLGMLGMVWFTLGCGTVLGWLALRGGSVWPAVIGHAAVNGIAALGVLLVKGQPSPLLGPLPVGIVGGLPWTVLAAGLLIWPNALQQRKASEALAAGPAEPAALPQTPAPLGAEELAQEIERSKYAE